MKPCLIENSMSHMLYRISNLLMATLIKDKRSQVKFNFNNISFSIIYPKNHFNT